MSVTLLHCTRVVAVVLAICSALVPISAVAQTAQQNKNVGALAEANLKKARPAAPVDLTGTYNFRIEGGPVNGFQFLPLPQLTDAAKASEAKRVEFASRGLAYRDDSAACWPLGMPLIMTRYWPIQVVQLPTMVLLVSMFDNNVRWIYTDGRKHPAEEELILTYNGHSIGQWEGKTLVVDTIGMTDDHHWMQNGIPASTDLHIVERFTLSPDRKVLQVQFNMTDPVNWVGEWKSTKHYDRDDNADIEEHLCIYEQMRKLPSFKANVRE